MEALYPYLKGDLMPFCRKIRKALEPAQVSGNGRMGIKINFSETTIKELKRKQFKSNEKTVKSVES